MDNRFHIDAGAPNLTPGLTMLQQAIQNVRSNARADEYLQMERDAVKQRAERESAAAKRQQAEDERRHAIEDFAARPALRRMAFQEGAGAANANPYNVQFSETHDLPANVEGPEMSPAAEEARFSPKPPQEPEFHVPEQPPVGALHASEEGPELNPAASAARYMLNGPQAAPRVLDPREEGPQQEQPQPLPIMAQAVANSNGIDLTPGPEGQRRMFESVGGGQPHELHERSSSIGLGPEYDAMFNHFRDVGMDDETAIKLVAAQYKSDQSQQHIDTRSNNQIDARNKGREDQQSFVAGENQKYRSTEQERRDIAAGHDRARIAGAREQAANPLKIDTANRQDMGTLRQGFKDWKNTINLSVDSKSHKRLATAMSNLSSGNAMQEREAAESLVSIFKGGGQVTKASQDLLLHHLAGIVGDAQTWIQQHLSGNFGAAELNVLKQATQNALKEEQEKLASYYESARDTFGPGSGYEQMGGNVNSMIKGAFKQFGYDAPDIYQGAEPVVLGSGERPKTPPKKAPPMSDDQALQLARKRYKANPNDETAKRVLQMHGELQ